jgi:hypothetical protein
MAIDAKALRKHADVSQATLDCYRMHLDALGDATFSPSIMQFVVSF